MHAAARTITGFPQSIPSHSVLVEAGLALVAARRSELAARFLAKAYSLPAGDPLRVVAETYAPRRLPSVFGWREVGQEMWDAIIGVTLPIEPLLQHRLSHWTESGDVSFCFSVLVLFRSARRTRSSGRQSSSILRPCRSARLGSGRTGRRTKASQTAAPVR